VRVLALSDLHVDLMENAEIVCQLSRRRSARDILIVAGDVTHRLDRLSDTLARLRDAYAAVCYVPGNHELWSMAGDPRTAIERFWAVQDVCRPIDVTVRPTRFGEGASAVWIVPLFAWYTRPEEGPDSLFRPKPGEAASFDGWADDHLVRWTLPDRTPTDYFLSLNEPPVPSVEPTISFSHFLPRADLMYPFERGEGDTDAAFNFSRVAGTTRLDERIRQMGSALHVYGHQHRDRCRRYGATWYVSHCLGYPRERRSPAHPKRPRVVWEDGACPLSSERC